MKLTKRIGLFAILFGVPLIFLYTLARGKNNSQDLPYFGKTEELGKQTEIKDFTFYDIDSNIINKETTKGQTLIVLEAMKMEHQLKSMVEGIVESISVEKGQQVKSKQILLNISSEQQALSSK